MRFIGRIQTYLAWESRQEARNGRHGAMRPYRKLSDKSKAIFSVLGGSQLKSGDLHLSAISRARKNFAGWCGYLVDCKVSQTRPIIFLSTPRHRGEGRDPPRRG